MEVTTLEGRERVCEVCEWPFERDADVFMWHGIYFLDICPSIDCRRTYTHLLEGEQE